MIEITDKYEDAQMCDDCTHRHVCKYKYDADSFTESRFNPYVILAVKCKFYTQQTIEPIKIN